MNEAIYKARQRQLRPLRLTYEKPTPKLANLVKQIVLNNFKNKSKY